MPILDAVDKMEEMKSKAKEQVDKYIKPHKDDNDNDKK